MEDPFYVTEAQDRASPLPHEALCGKSTLVDEAVRPLDSRRLEIRQQVACRGNSTSLHYQVETWFFLPTSLQINRWTFPPQNLQQNLKNYIRLGVPACEITKLLNEHAGLIDEAEANLDRILESIENSHVAPAIVTPDSVTRYEESLKRYALLIRSALGCFRSRLEHVQEPEERERLATVFTREFCLSLRRYRRLSVKSARARAHMHLPPFLFVDEYLSVLASDGLARVLHLLREGSVRRRLFASVTAQMAYRRHRYPGSIPAPESDNEGPAFRWSILKKFVDMPLYLEIRRREGTSILVHTICGIAAALAMIFATAVAFWWQMEYGALSGPLFVAMVVGYIFKDRMKDVARARLFSLFRRWIPDRRQDLHDGRGNPVGVCEESFRFDEWDRLPEDVREIRNRTHFVEILNSFHSEDILHYSKDVNIRKLPKTFAAYRKLLLDITRLDVSDFVRHAADAIGFPQLREEPLVPGEKTYHVDMVRRITYYDVVVLERFRIVLTSAGIKRIDEISAASNPAASV